VKTRKRIDVKDGNITVPIYEFPTVDIVWTRCLERPAHEYTSIFGSRQVEARRIIAKIASGRSEEVSLTLAEVEDYRLAVAELKPLNVSLMTVVREWMHAQGKGTSMPAKRVPDIVDEFLTSKSVEGAGFFHLEDRKYRLRKFAEAFQIELTGISTHEVEAWLTGWRLRAAHGTIIETLPSSFFDMLVRNATCPGTKSL